MRLLVNSTDRQAGSAAVEYATDISLGRIENGRCAHMMQCVRFRVLIAKAEQGRKIDISATLPPPCVVRPAACVHSVFGGHEEAQKVSLS